jgi:methylmalonyl-CoA decarboxylase
LADLGGAAQTGLIGTSTSANRCTRPQLKLCATFADRSNTCNPKLREHPDSKYIYIIKQQHNAVMFLGNNNTGDCSMPIVEVQLADNIGTITLNNPEKRNALSAELVQGITAALAEFKQQKARAVILRAKPGVKVWSAGHDVWELPVDRRDPLGWDDPLRHLIREIEDFPAPVIAMIEGTVWGGACETALACDLIVAAPSSTFAVTPAQLGVPYNISGVLTFLNGAPYRIIKEMLFTAQPITAERAEQVGMINYVVDNDEIEAFTYKIAEGITKNAPLSISVIKEQLRILAGAHPMSPQGFERVAGLRRIVYDSADYQEGIRSFKEKRKPVFTGK